MKWKLGIMAIITMLMISCACSATGVTKTEKAKYHCTVNGNDQTTIEATEATMAAFDGVIAEEEIKVKAHQRSDALKQKDKIVNDPPMHRRSGNSFNYNLNSNQAITHKPKGYYKQTATYLC